MGDKRKNRGGKGVTAWIWQPLAHAGSMVSSKDVPIEA